jgi:hypothetical protein
MALARAIVLEISCSIAAAFSGETFGLDNADYLLSGYL